MLHQEGGGHLVRHPADPQWGKDLGVLLYLNLFYHQIEKQLQPDCCELTHIYF